MEAKLGAMGLLLASDTNSTCTGNYPHTNQHQNHDVIDLVRGDGMELDGDENGDENETSAPEKNKNEFTSDDKQTLRSMVAAARVADSTENDPPDCFCCVLTFEVFRDPVVTRSGNSFERSAVEEHLRKVGNWDPISREPMVRSWAFPNPETVYGPSLSTVGKYYPVCRLSRVHCLTVYAIQFTRILLQD